MEKISKRVEDISKGEKREKKERRRAALAFLVMPFKT